MAGYHKNTEWKLTNCIIERVDRITPEVAFDVRSNFPFVSQANARQFGRKI